jgi:hypothetical protein
MSTNVGTLTIEMAANIARLSKDMDSAKRTVEKSFGDIENMVGRLKNTLGGVFAGLTVTAFVSKVVEVQRQFDVLNSSLVTVTGSSDAADRAFAWIKQFAATTPFSLGEVTQAFIKMKALGLDSSRESLVAYGNTASAMGKSLNQFIEAVADAATGEFERLKEFGIKARQEGDKVSLTFQGVTTTIGNNAADITDYLQAIGNVDFAGAMERRAATLDGAISNLADTWDELFRTISSQEAGGIIYDSVKLATSAIEDMITIIKALSSETDKGARSSEAFKVIQEAIAVVFETVVAVGVNVKYVITQVINEIVGLYQQSKAILSGNFDEARAIRQQMVADAEAARLEVDQTTERILNARKNRTDAVQAEYNATEYAAKKGAEVISKEAQKQLEAYEKLINSIDDRIGALHLEEQTLDGLSDSQKTALKVMQDIQNGTLKLTDAQKRQVATSLEQLIATEKVTDETKKQYEAFKKLTDSIEDKTKELQIDLQTTGKLTDAQKLAYKTMLELQSGTLKLTDAQKQQIAAAFEQLLATDKLNEEFKQQEEYLKAVAKETMSFLEAQDKKLESLTEDIEKQKEANREIELGKEAVEALRVAKLRETAASLDRKAALLVELGLDGEIAQSYREQAKALRELADLKQEGIHVQAAKDAADEWKKTSESITESLTDALLRGFESGKDFGQNMIDTLKNMFNTLVLRPIIQPIAQGMSSTVLGMFGMGAPGSASADGGAMGTFNVMSVLKSAYDSITGSFASLGNSISFAAQEIGAWLVSNTTGALNRAGASLMTNAGAIGTGASYLGGAAAGYGIGNLISGDYAAFGNKNVSTVGGTAIGAVLGGPIGAAIGGATGGVINRAFGMGPKEVTNTGITGTFSGAGADVQSFTDWVKEGGWFRSDKTGTDMKAVSTEMDAFLDGALVMVSAATKDYARIVGLNADAIDGFSQQIEISLKGLTAAEQEQVIAKAIQEFQDNLTAQIGAALVPFQLAGETLTQTLVRLAEIQLVSEQLNEFGGAFTSFAMASVTARQSIIELAGGIEQLVQKAQGFVANFYTREEQAAITARGVVTALAQSGFTEAQIAALETKASFRLLLESIDVSTELGQQQFVALLNLQQQFSDLAPVLDEQQKSLIELIEAAPQVEILQKMFETDASYQERVQTAEEAAQAVFQSMADKLGTLDVSVNNIGVIIGNGLMQVALSVSGAIQTAQAQAAAATAAAQASAAASMSSQSTFDLGLDTTGGGAAMGGYISGPTLVGEHGPEIFNPQTSQVYTSPATASMLGGGDVAAEIRALRDEVSLMRSETRATAVNTSKMVRLQDNWDVRGLTIKTDADQPINTVAA